MKIPKIGPRGFSLIELLVVISIFAVLSTILLSAISTIRDKARKAKSASNLRAIGGAMVLFAQDHDNRMMPSSGVRRPLGGDQVWWALFLLPYVDDDPAVFDRPGLDVEWEDLKAYDTVTDQQIRIGYWINAGAASDIPFPHGSTWRDDILIKGVNPYGFYDYTKPADTVAIVDGIGGDAINAWNPGMNGKWKSGYNDKYYIWKDGTFNILWLDGHVSAQHPEDMSEVQFVYGDFN